jgi:hypothetical protein
MISSILEYNINTTPIRLNVLSEDIKRGSEEISYLKDGRSIYSDWEDDGFKIVDFLNIDLFSKFYDFINSYFTKNLQKLTNFNTSIFKLEKYHDFVDDSLHLKFLRYIAAGSFGINGIPLKMLPFDYNLFNDLVSENCRKDFTCKKRFYGLFVSNHFWIRVVRPNKNDNNPPHRDCELKRNKKIVNIYAPIAGSNEFSSLPIIPGSHFWADSNLTFTKGKTYVEGVKFTNPAIVKSKLGLNMITPNPELGKLMIFTPYAIHGGGKNLNKDLTRISLEMRFWPK